MMCEDPIYLNTGFRANCGKCDACKINEARKNVSTIILELESNWRIPGPNGGYNACFPTLTYEDFHCPLDYGLVKKDVQDFMKRLRRRIDYHYGIKGIKVHYVGEYGGQTYRPHYHAIIFGLTPAYANDIHKAWGKGQTRVGDVNPHSVGYVCNYMNKDAVSKDVPYIEGRPKPFRGGSMRLGYAALPYLCKVALMLKDDFLRPNEAKFPKQVLIGGKFFPIKNNLIQRGKKMLYDEQTLEEDKKRNLLRMQINEWVLPWENHERRARAIANKYKFFNRRGL